MKLTPEQLDRSRKIIAQHRAESAAREQRIAALEQARAAVIEAAKRWRNVDAEYQHFIALGRAVDALEALEAKCDTA